MLGSCMVEGHGTSLHDLSLTCSTTRGASRPLRQCLITGRHTPVASSHPWEWGFATDRPTKQEGGVGSGRIGVAGADSLKDQRICSRYGPNQPASRAPQPAGYCGCCLGT